VRRYAVLHFPDEVVGLGCSVVGFLAGLVPPITTEAEMAVPAPPTMALTKSSAWGGTSITSYSMNTA
jgi:hypothetical protein